MAPRKIETPETKPQDPLKAALAAHPRDRTAEQNELIHDAGIDVRMKSLEADREKMRTDPR